MAFRRLLGSRAAGPRLAAAAAGALGIGTGVSALQQHGALRSAAEPAPSPPARLQQAASAVQRLYCWGQLAPSTDTAEQPARMVEREPVDVSFWSSRGLTVSQVQYGGAFAVALDNKGGLWAWSAEAGPTPRQLPCRSRLRSLACSPNSLYAVTSGGYVLEWRDLGAALHSTDSPLPPEPKPLGGALSRVSATSVAAGAAKTTCRT